MSSAYWQQWDESEIESMHDVEDTSDDDCELKTVEIDDEDDKIEHMFRVRGMAYAYMVD